MSNAGIVPSTVCFLSFFLASVIFAYLPSGVKIIFILLFLVSSILLCVRQISSFLFHGNKRLRKSFLLGFIAAFLAGALSFCSFDLYYKKAENAAGKREKAYFTVIECEKSYSYLTFYRVKVKESAYIPKNAELILSYTNDSLLEGDYIYADVTYVSLTEKSNGSFDGKSYYLPRGIVCFAESELLDVLYTKNSFSIEKMFGSLKKRLSSLIRANCGKDSGALASAVLLGDKDELSPSISRDFRRCGISHLLVISGTHFSALITCLEMLMRRMRLKPNLRAVINMIFTLFFMLLIGFTPSVVRAGIMHLLASLSELVSRKPNMIHSYALSGAAIVLFSPFSVLDIGLKLSYTATFACFVYIGKRGELHKRLHLNAKNSKIKARLRRLLITMTDTAMLTLTVTMYTLPLSWLYFGEISLVSVPVNIIALPLITGLMYITALYVILYPVALFIVPLSRLIDIYAGFVLSLIGRISELDAAIIPINYDITPVIIIPMVILLILIPFSRKNISLFRLTTVFFAVFILSMSLYYVLGNKSDCFSYIPEESNDGFVLKSDGKVMIGDMSNASLGYTYCLTDEAHSSHVTTVDTVLLTHYHNKHLPFFSLISEREIVRNLVLPEPQNEKEEAIYEELVSLADGYGINVITLCPEDEYEFGSYSVSVYPRTFIKRSSHPVSGVKITGENNGTIVLASSSVNESDATILADISEAEYAVFGAHSPVYKNNFDISFTSGQKTVIASDAALYHMNIVSDKSSVEIKERGIFKIKK